MSLQGLSLTLVALVVGTTVLLVLALLFARNGTNLEAFKSLPLYMLIGGGLLGAGYVTVNIVLTPRIGVAAIMALGIAGQLFTALLIDRLGLFGLVERGLTLGRVSGALLVLVGALMVRSL